MPFLAPAVPVVPVVETVVPTVGFAPAVVAPTVVANAPCAQETTTTTTTTKTTSLC